jgi:hypothetical protein
MKRISGFVPVVLLSLVVVLSAGCGLQGGDGTSYLALDWVYAPQRLYFPELPSLVLADVHYQHSAGTYYGEYIAWDGSYYSFYYTIEINEGEYGSGMLPGEDGMDRYYTMYLYSWGPELYYFDDLDSKSLTSAEWGSPQGPALEERLYAEQSGLEPAGRGEVENGRIELEDYDLDVDSPQSYLFESRGSGYTLRIEGTRLLPK